MRSRLLKKGGHIFVQSRLLWWWGTTSVETSPLPRGPPPSCLKVATGSFAPGRSHREGQFPPLLRAQRRISRDTLRMTITYPRRTYPPSFPMALSTGPEVWEDSCLTDHRCANHRFIRGVQHVSYHRARRRSSKYDIIEFRIEGGYGDF